MEANDSKAAPKKGAAADQGDGKDAVGSGTGAAATATSAIDSLPPAVVDPDAPSVSTTVDAAAVAAAANAKAIEDAKAAAAAPPPKPKQKSIKYPATITIVNHSPMLLIEPESGVMLVGGTSQRVVVQNADALKRLQGNIQTLAESKHFDLSKLQITDITSEAQ